MGEPKLSRPNESTGTGTELNLEQDLTELGTEGKLTVHTSQTEARAGCLNRTAHNSGQASTIKSSNYSTNERSKSTQLAENAQL